MNALEFFDKYDRCPLCSSPTERSVSVMTVSGKMTYIQSVDRNICVSAKYMTYFIREHNLPKQISLSDFSPLERMTIMVAAECYNNIDPSSMIHHRCSISSNGFAPERKLEHTTHNFGGYGITIWTNSRLGERTEIRRNKSSFYVPQVPFEYFDFSSKEALNDQVDKLLLLY